MTLWRTPLDSARRPRALGQVRILVESCKGCAFCVEYCPEKVLAMSTRFNRKGYHPPVVIDDEGCVACHLCEVICPDFAIFCLESGDAESAPALTPDSAGGVDAR